MSYSSGKRGLSPALATAAVLTAAAGAALGAILAWKRTGQPPSLAGVGPGVWRMNPDIGAEGMSALQRASLARTGIWALPSSEVIYFVAERDEAGKPLDPSAVYQIDGFGDPQARWWSISVYRDFFWVENPLDRYSYSKTTVGRHVDGSYRILVASDEQQGNWLPTGGGSARLTLLFRLYQPSLSVLENPADVPLPTVRRVS